jgi:hypothetical protein
MARAKQEREYTALPDSAKKLKKILSETAKDLLLSE